MTSIEMEFIEFLNQKIEEIKQVISNQPIPPSYNPSEWIGKRFNCYAYALRACVDLDCLECSIKPGFISRCEHNDLKDTKEQVVQYFMEDCEALGLKVLPTDLEEQIGANEYKISIYYEKRKRFFHFARQDSNGKWSEKIGWFGEIKTIEKVDKKEDGYELIGVFKVSKK